MKIGKVECVKDIKCDNCGRVLRENVNYRYSIIAEKTRRGLLICEDCFIEFKKEISNMWIQI